MMRTALRVTAIPAAGLILVVQMAGVGSWVGCWHANTENVHDPHIRIPLSFRNSFPGKMINMFLCQQ